MVWLLLALLLVEEVGCPSYYYSIIIMMMCNIIWLMRGPNVQTSFFLPLLSCWMMHLIFQTSFFKV